MSEPVRMAIIGCGNRGRTYAGGLTRTGNAMLRAVCDHNQERMSTLRDLFSSERPYTVQSDEEIFADAGIEAVIICTPDPTHKDVACRALAAGKHVLLEKPMSIHLSECEQIEKAVLDSGCRLNLAFTLRAAPFYYRIHELVRSGAIGRVMGIEAAEHMGTDHGASYMRRWQRNSALSGGLLMNKCCHDLDIIRWLADAPAIKVASFGSRDFFNPNGHTNKYCSQCGTAATCRFLYKGTHVNLTPEMRENPSKYDLDLCVFNSDKDIVDNQVVIIEHANGVRATFTVQMFSDKSDRTIHVTGTEGYIRGTFSSGQIEILHCRDGQRVENTSESLTDSHGGGDILLVENFARAVRGEEAGLSNCHDGVENTATCLAAEEARLRHQVVQVCCRRDACVV